MTPLIVFTAITGDVNDVLSPTNVPLDARNRQARYICFTYSETLEAIGWEVHPIRFFDANPRRMARWHKAMSHRLFPDADITFWHDGTHQLKVNPWEIADDVDLHEHVIATFRHPTRSCVYEEIQACLALGNDLPERLRAQESRYRCHGYPQGNGLFETACVVRKTCRVMTTLNENWWQEIKSGSCRDQVSLPYVMWKAQFNAFGVLPGCRDQSRYSTFIPHP